MVWIFRSLSFTDSKGIDKASNSRSVRTNLMTPLAPSVDISRPHGTMRQVGRAAEDVTLVRKRNSRNSRNSPNSRDFVQLDFRLHKK